MQKLLTFFQQKVFAVFQILRYEKLIKCEVMMLLVLNNWALKFIVSNLFHAIGHYGP